MIHTAEMLYTTTNRKQIDTIMTAFDFPSDQQMNLEQQLIKNNDDGTMIPCPCSLSAYQTVGDVITGIKAISIRYFFTGEFKITIRFEPKLIITSKPTTEVFLATAANKELLTNTFYHAMGEIVGYDNPHFLDMRNWKPKRVDYTKNLCFPTQSHVDRFENITKRTSKNRHRSKSLKVIDLDLHEQSTANGNGSWKCTLYNKKAQIQQCYTGMPDTELDRLLREAEGIARFEVQCNDKKLKGLMKSSAAATPSAFTILDYLDEELATYILKQRYEDLIGWGDFYSLEAATKRINRSSYTATTKRNLINFMRLASQSKHITTLRDNFINGTTMRKYTDDNGNNITVKGSANTYRKRISDLLALGINAMPIARAQKLDYFANPMTPDDFITA